MVPSELRLERKKRQFHEAMDRYETCPIYKRIDRVC